MTRNPLGDVPEREIAGKLGEAAHASGQMIEEGQAPPLVARWHSARSAERGRNRTRAGDAASAEATYPPRSKSGTSPSAEQLPQLLHGGGATAVRNRARRRTERVRHAR
jgi:hypothetical protein